MDKHLSEDFILQIFKLAFTSRPHLDLLVKYLKLEYLPEQSYKDLWTTIRVEYEMSDNKKLPNKGVISQYLKKDRDIIKILSDLKDIEIDDFEAVTRGLETFIKQNLFVDSYNTIGDFYNKGKKKSAYSEFVKRAEDFVAFSLQSETLDTVFGGFKKRNVQREFDKINGSKRVRISTGIDELDRAINGTETGEFVLIMGDSGSGKSFLGNHLGINAARRGYNVYHAQAEGTKEQVLNRYDSAFTGTRYYNVKVNEFSPANLKTAHKTIDNIKAEIYVRAFEQFGSATVVDIRNDVRELQKTVDVKYVIVDYLDLIDPGDGLIYPPNMERFRQQKVARMLKNLAMELNVVVIAFTQASSIPPDDLNNPDFVITRFNIAEDKGKLRPADLFITINKTRDEKVENVCRLYIDKAREHPGGQTIKIKQNLAHSRFYDRKKTIDKFFNVDEDED